MMTKTKYARIIDGIFDGFYELPLNNTDSVFMEISNEKWQELLNEQSSGKTILYKDGKMLAIQLPSPEGFIRPELNYETLKWVELASDEDVAKKHFEDSVEFYNSELECAAKATAEFMCETITEEDYSHIREYIRAIDPYSSKYTTTLRISRPSIFDRYR